MVNTNVNSIDKLSLEQMVKDNSGLVWSIVKRFMPRGYEADDLYQIGSIGLIKAVRRFDPVYKVQFSTYAVPLIAGEIKRFLRDDGMVKVSRRYKEINAKAMAVKAKLESEFSKEPTMGEIAQVLGISVFDLTEAMEACFPCDSIYRTVTGDDKGETYLLDKLSLGTDGSMADRASLKCALDNLPERDRAVIAYRYFMDETQAKVASRLGISQVQISRIEKRVLLQLKKDMT